MHKHQKSNHSIVVLCLVFGLLASATLLALPTKVEAQANLAAFNQDFLWAKGMGGTGWDNGRRIAVDTSGNVYTTGVFGGTADFDPGAGTFNLTSAGYDDIFISELDSGGNLLWAKQIGGPGEDYGVDLYITPGGDLYVTGAFNATADFDPGAGIFNLTSAGNDDIFIAKYDSSGGLVWAKAIGGIWWDAGGVISVDANNDVIVAGYFEDTVDFDPGAGTFNLTSVGYNDIFISKLDSNGNFVWAKGMGGVNGDDEPNSVGIDSSGNIYVTGFYQRTADFDPGTATYKLTSLGDDEMYVAKLDKDGSFVWAKSVGGVGWDDGFSLVVDASNNIYITGYFRETVDFNPGAGTFELTSAGENDVFLLKLDGNGSFLWAKKFGGIDYDNGFSVAVDSSANIYTTGTFRSMVDFDPGAGTFNLTSLGGNDIFIAKLDGNGSFLWATSFGGSTYDYGFSIDLDSKDNIYLTGRYSATVDFDPGSGTFNLTSAGDDDIFISKFGNAATFIDVPSSHWAWSYIERLYTAGITSGCSTSPMLYCPTATVTRDQMAIFLLRGKHTSSYTPPKATGVFSDVPTDFWAADWIEQLALEGITSGCSINPRQYCPTRPVTRDQMAIFLLRAKHGSNYVPPKATGVFQDVPVDYWAADWIEQLAAEGITLGCSVSPKQYCPTTPVTRDQMAVFLVRNFNLP
jgi:hypothetical protein